MTTYSVMQTGMKWPEPEELKQAFQEVPGLAAIDAFSYGPDVFGMLARGLEREQAVALQGALAGQGIETETLGDDELPKLPDAKILNRLDCTPEALVVYDALGRGSPVAWSKVSIVAAGRVMMSEFKRVATPTFGQPLGDSLAPIWTEQFPMQPADRLRRHLPKNVYCTEEQQHQRFLVEIILAERGVRYSINADKSVAVLFQYLGERRTKDLSRNVSLLTQDLVRYAPPQAALNRGAYYIRENPEIPLAPYANKTAFYNELIWLLWMLGRT